MSLTTLITASVLAEKKIPTAVAKADPSFGIIGSVVKLDGRLSTDPDGNELTYSWTFDSVPIGSKVMGEGFRSIDDGNAVVTFSPDIVGEYVIGLTVSNGMYESAKAQTVSSIRAILVPHGRGLIPDGKWLWSYIRDVWQGVENREMFETLWSALVQIVGSEMLKLYEVDFNKSIRDTQDLYQRRWLSYEPYLPIKVNGPDFFLGKSYAGTNASTINLGLEGSLIILNQTEVVIVEGSILQDVLGQTLTISASSDPSNNASYEVKGISSAGNGYRLNPSTPVPNPVADKVAADVGFLFSLQSTQWEIAGSGVDFIPYAALMSMYGSPLDYLLPLFPHLDGGALDLNVGDVIHMKTGPNKGFYRVTSRAGQQITVDHAPPSFSNSTSIISHLADVYRPVHFELSQPESLLTNTIAIPYDATKDLSNIAPGRVITVNGQTFTIIRAHLDSSQRVPSVIITVDSETLQSGLTGLTWRTPPTLVSTTQDFTADGVSTGDTIVFDIIQNGQEITSVPCQVAGVDGGNLGFVTSLEPLTPGIVNAIPAETVLKIANDLKIDGVRQNADGTLSISGTASKYLTVINSMAFQDKYLNVRLTPDSDISINPTFQIKPRYIIRNNTIPVDETLRSIPLLQNYISPTTVVQRNGKYVQVKNGKEYDVAVPPLYLKENIDFTIDDEIAYNGEMTFKTGSDIIESDIGDFIDRNIAPGDQFIIDSPVTLSRTYYVQSVLSASKLKLTRAVPLYALSEFVTARVRIKRSRTGRFIRFVPGTFSASSPAPNRLWSEVSFFDNNENIENNFGILVGLTRDDVSNVSENLSYRQAVAGIMYAFTRGSSLDKIRIGAQILLGLPFAENRGIIRSIETDYRLNIHGDPILGRILVEDVDQLGAPLGTLRVYTYPIEEGSELAGLETNPATNLPYKLGDIVEKFSPLSKGVEVSDYISKPNSEPLSVERFLQRYHSVRVRINDDIFTLQEIGLVSSFLKKITPSYIAFIITSTSEFFDDVTVNDFLAMKVVLGGETALADNASLNMQPTMMYDSKSASGINHITYGSAPYWVRRSGTDLQTTNTSTGFTLPSGGFLNPRAGEVFEAPLTRVGDKILILGGENQGLYTVSVVSNDTTVTVSDAPTLGFLADPKMRYAILRPFTTVVRPAESMSFTSGSNIVTTSGKLRVDGVSPGDWLLNLGTTMSKASKLKITQILESTPGSGIWDTLKVDSNAIATGSDTFAIARSKIFESPSTPFNITGAAGSKFTLPANSLLKSLMDTGDILQVVDGEEYMVMDAESKYISPALGTGTTVSVQLIKKNRPSTGVGYDSIQFWDPIDVADVAISGTATATCTSGSADVTLPIDTGDLNILPTDFLKLSGLSFTDIGYGTGVYPIVEVVSASVVRLANTLSVSGTPSWSVIRRR